MEECKDNENKIIGFFIVNLNKSLGKAEIENIYDMGNMVKIPEDFSKDEEFLKIRKHKKLAEMLAEKINT